MNNKNRILLEAPDIFLTVLYMLNIHNIHFASEHPAPSPSLVKTLQEKWNLSVQQF